MLTRIARQYAISHYSDLQAEVIRLPVLPVQGGHTESHRTPDGEITACHSTVIVDSVILLLVCRIWFRLSLCVALMTAHRVRKDSHTIPQNRNKIKTSWIALEAVALA